MIIPIEQFMESLKLENLSYSTLASYRMHLLLFAKYCESKGKTLAKEVTLEDLTAYHEHLLTLPGNKNEAGLSQETTHLKLRIVKKFFEYLEQHDQLLLNPAEKFVLPKLKDRLPKDALSEKEIFSILAAPNIAAKFGLRDRAILELLYSTGLRCNECCRLSVFDVDTEGGLVRVQQGKGRKDRMAPLGKKACEYLQHYLLKVRPQLVNGVDCDYLFLTTKQGPLTGAALNAMIKKYAQQAKINQHVTVHTFRRTVTTHMLRNNAHPLQVQKLLGHQTGETLRQYVKLTIVDLKKVHQKTHPREEGERRRAKGKKVES